ncbi:MAG: VWA domain-containing protein [Kofleriaceae bacterium]|nr:VWA domain-containing protein [Kofleriaceae bacterium]
MRTLWIAVVMLWSTRASADAMLTGQGSPRFPSRVDVAVDIRAQIESTTITLALPPIDAAGNYTLTVPSPTGAAPIGVDIDRGDGFVELPVVVGAPPVGSGGSSSAAVQAWQGTTPLVAELRELAPGPLTARVRFVRVLRRVGGEVEFTVDASRCPARAATDPGAIVSIDLALATARDVTKLEATAGTIEPATRGGRIRTGDVLGGAQLGVRYAEAGSGIGVQLLTHRTPTADPLGGDAGYFMLLVDADQAPPTMPRALSLVIDHSGSMSGDKIEQARDAARAMLDYLHPDDSFTIHMFDDDVSSFSSLPVLATPGNIDAAREWIKRIEVDGGTDLNAGLQVALRAPESADRFDAAIMLSDGLATSGETDDRKILANAWHSAGADTRIFTFSVGDDADFALMEALARGSRGKHVDLNNAQATRDLVLRARELFEDIRDVRLTDLDLSIANLGVADTLPEAPQDLFSGGQVLIVGRYTTPGTGTIDITGREGTQPFARSFVVDAPALSESGDIIKYVWASEKVNALMAQIANGGDAAALRSEIEQIGVAYRIQTPFTHYAGEFSGAGIGDSAGCSIGSPDTKRRDGEVGTILLVIGLVTRTIVRRRRVVC